MHVKRIFKNFIEGDVNGGDRVKSAKFGQKKILPLRTEYREGVVL